MTLTIQLPDEFEHALKRDLGDLNQVAKEAMLVELYRQLKITHLQLAQALGLDRFQTEEILHKHQVTEDLGTVEDYLADAKLLEQLRRAEL